MAARGVCSGNPVALGQRVDDHTISHLKVKGIGTVRAICFLAKLLILKRLGLAGQ